MKKRSKGMANGTIIEKMDKVENKLIAHDSSLFKMEMGGRGY